jgi:hydroxymethylbilane synthase
MRVVAGTRGSTLARAQTESVIERIRSNHPRLQIEVRVIRTEGDLRSDRPLSEIGGKGVFVKELESALQRGEIDLAVHSLKDVPAEEPADLVLGAVLTRADARDALVSREGHALRDLPAAAVVATGSLRRSVQLRAIRPELEVRPIRGNVDTRLRKLEEGQYQALVLAAAGLQRLGRIDRVTEFLDPGVMLPSVGQGVLAVQLRADSPLRNVVAELEDVDTRIAITAERSFLARLGAGCQLPVAAYARVERERVLVAGMIGREDGTLERSELSGPISSAAELGKRLANELIARIGDWSEGANGTTG